MAREKGRPCVICTRIIPMDEACITAELAEGFMCLSHEGEKVPVWKLTMDGTTCFYRAKGEADEDREMFKAQGDPYTFRKAKMRCVDILLQPEFVGW